METYLKVSSSIAEIFNTRASIHACTRTRVSKIFINNSQIRVGPNDSHLFLTIRVLILNVPPQVVRGDFTRVHVLTIVINIIKTRGPFPRLGKLIIYRVPAWRDLLDSL